MTRTYKNVYGDGRVEYVEYEIEEATTAEQTSYTEEELTAMTNAELEEICAALGISPSMTKANMVELIMAKQSNSL